MRADAPLRPKAGQVLRQTLRQRADFRLIAANQVLQKGVGGLRQFISEELAANPALELLADSLCPSCGFPLRNAECRLCSLLGPQGADKETAGPGEPALGPTGRERAETGLPERPDVGEWAAPVSLSDHLRTQARAALSAKDQPIADYLIANIGEKGLLECGLEEVCQQLRVPLERVQEVLAVVQGFDPPGVAAATPQESLLAQLRQFPPKDVPPGSERIIQECWEDLAYHRYERIAHHLRCPESEVKEAVEFILANLNPYPASAFTGPTENSRTLRWPDLIFHREKDEYRVEVVESWEEELRISDSFVRLRQTWGKDGASAAALDSLRRACFFLACLKMRKRTLQEVGECVVRLQRGYLDTGAQEHLRPLTRAKVASLLGKHQSTVSRAVADKAVLLPWRQMVPFEHFFTPGAGPKSIIRQLLSQEREGRPLTDKQMAWILASRGHHISRRTVAKYRLLLGIPGSARRSR